MRAIEEVKRNTVTSIGSSLKSKLDEENKIVVAVFKERVTNDELKKMDSKAIIEREKDEIFKRIKVEREAEFI
jgi:hypothetical protein